MANALKYLPLVAGMQDVSAAYKSETGKERPAYLSRRLVGSVMAVAAGFMAVQYGVEVKEDTVKILTDNIEALIPAAISLYGIAVGIVGIIKRKKG